MKRLKATLVALILVGATLVGFTFTAQPASAASTYPAGACYSHRTIDWLWHVSQRAGYSYHLVEDDYFAYDNINGYCTYTSHVNVDLCNNLGCALGVFEAWIPYWGEVSHVNTYGFEIDIAAPYWGTNKSLTLIRRNQTDGAFCKYTAGSPFCYLTDLGGSEWERSYGPVNVWNGQTGTGNGEHAYVGM